MVDTTSKPAVPAENVDLKETQKLLNQQTTDADAVVPASELETFRTTAVGEIQKMVANGVLSEAKGKKFIADIQDLKPTEDTDQKPDTKEAAKEEALINLMAEIQKLIQEDALYLFVRSTGDSQQKAFGALLQDSEFPATLIELGADGAKLAEEIITKLKIPASGHEAIKTAVKTFVTAPLLKGQVALQKTAKGEIQVQEVKDGAWKTIFQAPKPAAKESEKPGPTTEIDRMQFVSFLKTNGELVFSTAPAEIPGGAVLNTIRKNYPNATAIQYAEGQGIQIKIGEVWSNIKLEGMSPAETYLATAENFPSKVQEQLKKKGFWNVFLDIIGNFLHIDFRAFLNDKGKLGDYARLFFGAEVDPESVPKMTDPNRRKLEKRMLRTDGNPIILGDRNGIDKDSRVKTMLDDLGGRFNQSGKVEVKNAETQDEGPETSGICSLRFENADDAAALVLFAQKKSSDFLGAVQTGVEKLDGKLKEIAQQSLDALRGDSDMNRYLNGSIKVSNYPDNVAADYRGIVDGKYQVDVHWFSDEMVKKPKEKEEEKPKDTASSSSTPDTATGTESASDS